MQRPFIIVHLLPHPFLRTPNTRSLLMTNISTTTRVQDKSSLCIVTIDSTLHHRCWCIRISTVMLLSPSLSPQTPPPNRQSNPTQIHPHLQVVTLLLQLLLPCLQQAPLANNKTRKVKRVRKRKSRRERERSINSDDVKVICMGTESPKEPLLHMQKQMTVKAKKTHIWRHTLLLKWKSYNFRSITTHLHNTALLTRTYFLSTNSTSCLNIQKNMCMRCTILTAPMDTLTCLLQQQLHLMLIMSYLR